MAFDYSTLDEEQKINARKVLAAANRYGINPDFVFPLVMAESQFRHVPSHGLDKKTKQPVSFGVMQLKESTAKQYGISDYKKASEEENIDAGMRLLRDLASNPKIDTPEKMVAGYNAGPGTKFVSTGNAKDLPSETSAHIANVKKFSPVDGLATHTSPTFVPSEVEDESQLHQKFAGEGNQGFNEEGPGGNALSPEEQKQHQELAGSGNEAWKPGETTVDAKPPSDDTAMLGAGLGAITGATLSGASNIAQYANEFLGSRKGAPSTPVEGVGPTTGETTTGKTTTGEEGKTPGEKWGQKTGFGVGKGSVANASQSYQRLKNQGPVSSKMDKRFGPRLPGEPASLVDRLMERSRQKEAAELQARQQAELEAKLKAQQEATAAKNQQAEQFRSSPMGRTLNTVYNTGRAGLGGLATALSTKAALENFQNNEYVQGALHGISALGSGVDVMASALPNAARGLTQAGVRTVAAPIAIAADTAANLVHHGKQGQYGEMPLDVVQGGLAAIPYAGIPLSFGMGYARAHPEQTRRALGSLGDYYGNLDFSSVP